MDTDQSSATTPARTPTTPDELAERIEQELERLRAKRPHLSSRIDKAANIIVTHLSCPRQRIIRVRVGDGRLRVLMKGSGGSVYIVDPETYTCTCPDHHRREITCKHAISVYLIVRAARPAPKLPACTSCEGRFPHAEFIEITHEDESLTWFPGDLLCKSCIVTMGGIS